MEAVRRLRDYRLRLPLSADLRGEIVQGRQARNGRARCCRLPFALIRYDEQQLGADGGCGNMCFKARRLIASLAERKPGSSITAAAKAEVEFNRSSRVHVRQARQPAAAIEARRR